MPGQPTEGANPTQVRVNLSGKVDSRHPTITETLNNSSRRRKLRIRAICVVANARNSTTIATLCA